MIRMLDTFAGLGGFSLAARWTGAIQTVCFVEIEPYCQAVLRKNFPGVLIHADIRTLTADTLRGRGIDGIDLITGGFPCQDISAAGKGAGLDGERSGLWYEMLRLIRELRPRFCLIENVPALRSRGADAVLCGLEAAGYTAGAFVVGADDIGATHRRKRIWIVAMADAACKQTFTAEPFGLHAESALSVAALAHSDRKGLPVRPGFPGDTRTERASLERNGVPVADAASQSANRFGRRTPQAHAVSRHGVPTFPPARNDWRGWAAVAEVDASLMPCVEREVRGVASRLPADMVRRRRATRNAQLKALGNAIVPQVAYLFLSAIVEAADLN